MPARETNHSVLRRALVRAAERRIGAGGAIALPCVPGAVDAYMAKLETLWKSLGRPLPEQKLAQLREALVNGLRAGYDASPVARVIIEFGSEAQPDPVLQYVARLMNQTTAQSYTDWAAERTPPLFGKYPDAKVVDLARSLGEPGSVPVLDLGAGTGRNALALAGKGHPTTAVEVVPAFAQEMRERAAASGVALDVIEADIESPALELPRQHFKVAVMSEVVTHFRSVDTLRAAFTTLAEAVAPGGVVLFNTFLAKGDYAPDSLARQTAEMFWASMWSRAELETLERDFPFARTSDESAYEYERDHLPEDGWPPTGWFENWARGRDIFDLPAAQQPVELRWLVYRRLEAPSRAAGAGPVPSNAPKRRKASSREPSHAALRPALLRSIDRRIRAQGVLALPCLPAMLDEYVGRLAAVWGAVGKPFSAAELDELRGTLAGGLEAGHRASPHAVLTLHYETQAPPNPGLTYQVRFTEETSAEYHAQWLSKRKPPLDASSADAKLIDLAASLGDPRSVSVLDVDAGAGRNALALAARGHPTTAVVPGRDAANGLRRAALDALVALEILEGDIASPAGEGPGETTRPVALSPGRFKLAVLSDVVTRYREPQSLRLAFETLTNALAPGGLVLLNAFVVEAGYEPDALAKQVAGAAQAFLFRRADLDLVTRDFPFDTVSDEAARDYEQRHTARDAWPPTGWFENWARGRDIFDLPDGKAPVELRWLVYRRR
jgi:SAM-dependent methyltransferase